MEATPLYVIVKNGVGRGSSCVVLYEVNRAGNSVHFVLRHAYICTEPSKPIFGMRDALDVFSLYAKNNPFFLVFYASLTLWQKYGAKALAANYMY